MFEWLKEIPFAAWLLIAAGAGGLVGFLYGCKMGHIKNNKHLRKMAVEIAGGSLVGFFLVIGAHFGGDGARLCAAFACGLGWAKIVHVIRRKATDIVEAAFGLQGRSSEKGGGSNE